MSLNQAPCHCFSAKEKHYVTTGLRCLRSFIQVVKVYNLHLEFFIIFFWLSHLPDTSAASSLPISEVLPPSSGKKQRQHSDRLFCPLFLSLFSLFTWLHYFQSESQLIGEKKKLGVPTSSPGRVCTAYSKAESSLQRPQVWFQPNLHPHSLSLFRAISALKAKKPQKYL